MSQNITPTRNLEEQLKVMNDLLRRIAKALEGLDEQGIVVHKRTNP